MAKSSDLYPGAISTISSKRIVYNGINLYGQLITIVNVFKFNGKDVAEVRFHDESIPLKYIFCRHISRPKSAANKK
jgi:hypothetical protein